MLDLSDILPPTPSKNPLSAGLSPEIIREIEDASEILEPQPKQLEFLSIPFEIDEAFYGGANFGGKSWVLLAYPIYHRFYLHPEFMGIVFRETYQELFKSLLPRAERFYKPFGGEWNGEQKCFIFKSGARMFMSYLDSLKAAHSHDTNQFNYIGFEEATHYEWDWVSYLMFSRCRSSTKELPAINRLVGAPGNVGHGWLKKRYIDPAPEGGKIIEETLDNGDKVYRMYVRALVQDNPKGIEADPTYINKLLRLPEAEKRAKLYGDWNAYVGEVFSEWREERYSDEPPNALHVIEPFEIPYWWPKLAAIDWGWDANTWMGWGAISPDERLFIYRERMYNRTPISRWSTDFALETSQDGNFIGIWLDPSAWKQRGDPKSIAQQFADHSGYNPQPADNARVSGKMLLHDMMRWRPRGPRYVPREGFLPDKFRRIRQLDGELAAADYARLFLPEPKETNLPLIQVFNTCKGLIGAIPQCIPNPDKPEDIAEFSGDDPIDGIRYLCKAVQRFLNRGSAEDKSRHALQTILKKFGESGDMTQFYRMMEIHEHNMKGDMKLWNRRREAV